MIRLLNPLDVDEFIRIRLESLKVDPLAFGSAYEEGVDREVTIKRFEQHNEANFIVGYWEGKKLQGIVGFIQHTRPKIKHKGFIWGMYVDSSLRGKGIGRELLVACLEKAKQIEGLQKISLSVTHTQAPALHLYQQIGFQEYGRERCSMLVDGIPCNEIFMDYFL